VDYFMMYAIAQADSIKTMLIVVSVALTLVVSFCGFVFSVENQPLKSLRPLLFALTASITFATLMPSTKTLLFIAAGKAVIEASKTDAAQSIASNSVKLLDNFIAEQAAKYDRTNKAD
jgi:uncharacterized membrane protein